MFARNRPVEAKNVRRSIIKIVADNSLVNTLTCVCAGLFTTT